jgi:hypothetical protein
MHAYMSCCVQTASRASAASARIGRPLPAAASLSRCRNAGATRTQSITSSRHDPDGPATVAGGRGRRRRPGEAGCGRFGLQVPRPACTSDATPHLDPVGRVARIRRGDLALALPERAPRRRRRRPQPLPGPHPRRRNRPRPPPSSPQKTAYRWRDGSKALPRAASWSPKTSAAPSSNSHSRRRRLARRPGRTSRHAGSSASCADRGGPRSGRGSPRARAGSPVR